MVVRMSNKAPSVPKQLFLTAKSSRGDRLAPNEPLLEYLNITNIRVYVKTCSTQVYMLD